LLRLHRGVCLTALSGIVYTRSSSIFVSFAMNDHTLRRPRLQCLLFGWVLTVRFVRTITHAGTRLFCFVAFASRFFFPFVTLLIAVPLWMKSSDCLAV
jgi:hypothetical protein